MRGFLISELAHHSQISPTPDVPEPTAGTDQVVIDVYSAGLNFFDILQAQGRYQKRPPLPFVLGTEFAGKIARNSPIPPGCPFKPGDRVFGHGQGTFAEKVAIDVAMLQPLPDTMTYDQGAGLYVTWPTSYEALVGRAQLKAGEWLLVTAAAGGVGIAAVQLAKALGAKVIAAAGSDGKIEVAKRYGGADYGVNYSKPGWHKEVMKITKGKGVDVVYDAVGLVKDALKVIAWKGRILIIGFAGGTIEEIPMNLVLLKNISIVGLHWGGYTRESEKDHLAAVWRGLLELFASGQVQPVNYKVFTLDTLHEGLDALERRETWGKAVVRIQDDVESAKL